MSKIDEQIAKQEERLEQLKRQKKDQMAREKERQRKLEHRRKLIIGEKVLAYFPDTLPLSLNQSAEKKAEQIALFEKQLEKFAAAQTKAQNQQSAQKSMQDPSKRVFDQVRKAISQQQNQQRRE